MAAVELDMGVAVAPPENQDVPSSSRAKLQHDDFPWELEAALRDFVAYNNERYHEAITNVTPADVCFGRRYEALTERSKIRRRAVERRKKE